MSGCCSRFAAWSWDPFANIPWGRRSLHRCPLAQGIPCGDAVPRYSLRLLCRLRCSEFPSHQMSFFLGCHHLFEAFRVLEPGPVFFLSTSSIVPILHVQVIHKPSMLYCSTSWSLWNFCSMAKATLFFTKCMVCTSRNLH